MRDTIENIMHIDYRFCTCNLNSRFREDLRILINDDGDDLALPPLDIAANGGAHRRRQCHI